MQRIMSAYYSTHAPPELDEFATREKGGLRKWMVYVSPVCFPFFIYPYPDLNVQQVHAHIPTLEPRGHQVTISGPARYLHSGVF